MTADDPLALDRQVCFALAATSRSVIGLYRPVLEPLGLTHPQYLVMLALWERSPRTVRDIADALYLEPPTMTPLLKRLEAIGYLSRDRNPLSERELRVALTPEGRVLRSRAEQVPGQIVARLGMPLEALEEVRDRLTALLAATRAAREVGTPSRRPYGSGMSDPRPDGPPDRDAPDAVPAENPPADDEHANDINPDLPLIDPTGG